jgi:hypothetical protein
MPCQHDKDALIEAASSGAGPQGDLRLHLTNCASCRATFEQEQSFFASIDAGLRITANPDVPASLLPRVRARLEEESARHCVWGANWLVLASASAMIVVFSAALSVWRTNVTHNLVETAAKPNVSLPQKHDASTAPFVEKDSASQRQVASFSNPSGHKTPSRTKSDPEVLVPRDQEILLAEYAEHWSLHKRAPLVAGDSDAMVLAPLQVAQIQIAELDVKLLADEKSQ